MTTNPYLNTPPTKLKRQLTREKSKDKRRLMQKALDAWRSVVPVPFRKQSGEILDIVRELEGCGNEF